MNTSFRVTQLQPVRQVTEGVQTITAQPGAVYTVIDPATGEPPAGMHFEEVGDTLTIKVDGETVVRFDGFFAEDVDAVFSMNGKPISTVGTPVASTDAAVDAAIAPDAASAAEGTVVWEAAESNAGAAVAAEDTATAGSGYFDFSPLAMGLGTLGLFGVAAASGGGGSSLAGLSSLATTTLTVAPAAGVFSGTLTVEIYDGDGNQRVSATHDFSTGNFVHANTDTHVGTMLVKLIDNVNGVGVDYIDETTGSGTSLNTTLRVMTESDGVSDMYVGVTPLTELAARQAIGIDTAANNVVTSENLALNARVGALFGVADITASVVTVDNPDYGAATTDEQKYGKALALLSGADAVTTGGVDELLTELNSGLQASDTNTDGALAWDSSATNILNSGVAAFEGGPNAAVVDFSSAVGMLPPDFTLATDSGSDNADLITNSGALAPPATTIAGATMKYRVQGPDDTGFGAWGVYTDPATDSSADGAYVVEGRWDNGAGNTSPSQAVSFTLDTTAPTLSSLTSDTTDGTYGPGDTITLIATYDEAPVAGSAITVSLDNSASVTLDTISGNTLTGTYTVGATGSGEDSGDLTVSTITSQATVDAAGNTQSGTSLPSTNVAAGSALVIDTSAPTLNSLTSNTTNGTYGPGSTITLIATYDEAPAAGSAITVLLDTSASVTLDTVSGNTLTGTYTVGATGSGENSGDLTVSTITSQATVDAAGNTQSGTSLPGTNVAAGSALVIGTGADTTAPVLLSFTSDTADGTYGPGDTITLIATYDEAPDTGSTITVTLDTSASVTLDTISGNTLTGTYTVGAIGSGEDSGDLMVSAITSQTTVDIAGNTQSGATLPVTNVAAGSALVIDANAPTITGVTANWQADAYLNATEDDSDGTVTVAATGADGEMVTITLNSADYTGTLAGGTVDITVAAAALQALTDGSSYTIAANVSDAAGNAATEVSSASFTVDTTAPTITSVTADWQTDTYLNATEDDSDGTVTVAATGAADGQTVTITLNGTDYTGALSGGTVDITVAAADLQALTDGSSYTIAANVSDVAGNAASEVPSASFTVDTTAPTVSAVTLASDNANDTTLAKAADTVTFDITYSEAVTASVTSATTANNIAGAVTTDASASAATSDSVVFTVASGDDGAVTANTVNYTITDAAGNVTTISSLATTDSSTVTADTTAPTLSSLTSNTTDGTYGPGDTITLIATYDETPATGSTITVALDTGVSVTLNTISGNTLTGAYTVGATGSGESSGDLTVSSITGQATTDVAGNTQSGTTLPGTNIAAGSALVIDTGADTTAPVLLSFTSDTADGTYGPGDTITLIATYDEAPDTGSTITVTLDTSASVTLDTISGNTLTGTYTVGAIGSGEDSGDLMVSAITSQTTVDIAGNTQSGTSLPVTNVAAGSALVIDANAPTFTVTSDATSAGVLGIDDTITFTVTPTDTEAGATVTGSYNSQTL